MNAPVHTPPVHPAFGFYPGRVVNVQDPKKAGCVRVRQEQVYGDATQGENEFIPDDRLPWARPSFGGAGSGVGDFWVPPVGSQVWLSFWGGDRTKPIWWGGWGVPSTVPTEFSSSYGPTPAARVIRTEGGQLMQFRWKDGEERFEVVMRSGTRLLLDDTTATGPRIAATLPSGRKLVADDKAQRIEASDATGQSVIIDGAAQKVMVSTPGEVDVTAGGNVVAMVGGNLMATVVGIVSVICSALSVTAAGVVNLVSGGAVTLGAAGAVTVVAAGAVAITGAGVSQTSTGPGATSSVGGGVDIKTFVGAGVWNYLSLALTATAGLAFSAGAALSLTAGAAMTLTALGLFALVGSNITLGAALATKLRLLDERFISGLGGYNAHTHGGVPLDQPIAPGFVVNYATTHTKAS